MGVICLRGMLFESMWWEMNKVRERAIKIFEEKIFPGRGNGTFKSTKAGMCCVIYYFFTFGKFFIF